MKKLAKLAFVAMAGLVLALGPQLALPSGTALAQEAGERRGGGLLRFLFNRESRPRRAEQPAARPAEPAPRQPRAQRRAPEEAAPPPVAAIEKSPDAKRVLVVGDFLAGGLADGLQAAFAEDPDVIVVNRSNGSSGLVRDDYYDWPGNIGTVIGEAGPDVLVVLIGSNDRQQMTVDGASAPVRSEAWMKEYEARATALAQAAANGAVPLVWVGALPFRSAAMSSDMTAFNDVYRSVAAEVRGEFVDVWGGFVDENGAFMLSGPDMNGQPARLRAEDGINVTRAGRRKIAFYVEKPLARILGGSAPGAPLLPGTGEAGLPLAGPEALKTVDRTAPVALGDFGAGGGELLGRVAAPRDTQVELPADRLLRHGIAPEVQPGRADDFNGARGG